MIVAEVLRGEQVPTIIVLLPRGAGTKKKSPPKRSQQGASPITRSEFDIAPHSAALTPDFPHCFVCGLTRPDRIEERTSGATALRGQARLFTERLQ